MSTVTTNLGMIKAEGSDIVNVVTHVANNFQILDNTFAANTPSTQAIGDAAAQGSAVVVSRSDHKHAMPAFGTPVSVGAAIANGSSANIARADHVHDLGAALFGTVVALDGTLSDGSGSTVARANHKHSFAAGAFGNVTNMDGTGQNGTASTASRSDHEHGIAVASQANGDLFYATSANTFTRLGIGSGNAYLTISGGVPAWGASGQIVFPAAQNASANANTLDDYEEGTWTPSIGGTATYTSQVGRYTKIGNLVWVNFFIAVNVIGTGSTTDVSGLPFTHVNGGVSAAGSVVYSSNLLTNVVSIYAYVASNSAVVRFSSFAAAAAGHTAPYAPFKSGTNIEAAVTYDV